jgi:hypothetical protein
MMLPLERGQAIGRDQILRKLVEIRASETITSSAGDLPREGRRRGRVPRTKSWASD